MNTTDNGLLLINNEMMIQGTADEAGSLIEEEMTFEELSSKLGYIEGGVGDQMQPFSDEHRMSDQPLMMKN